MYIDEPNVEPYPNLIEKFEFESNFILAESELEPKPCDLGQRILAFINKALCTSDE
jgi:hypothetical protein